MARNLRTALLTTAVASGLLLSTAPVQAQIVEGETATTQSAVPETVQEPAAPVAEFADEEPTSATAPDQVLGAEKSAETVGAEATHDEAPVDAPATPSNSDSASGEPSTFVPVEGDTTESPDGLETGETQGAVGVAGMDPDDTSVLVTEPVVESTTPGPITADVEETGVLESDEADATEVQWELVELPWWLEGIEIPEGAENWTDAQWDDFIIQIAQDLENEPAFQELESIIGDLIEHGRESDLDALYGHLLWMFDGNEAAAQEAFEEILSGLVESGDVDAGILDREEPKTPAPSATPEPSKPAETPKAEIKPAGTVVKPVLDNKPIVKAVVKPVVNSKTGELAETGSSGALVYAGSGAALLLLGTIALRMRRKSRAH